MMEITEMQKYLLGTKACESAVICSLEKVAAWSTHCDLQLGIYQQYLYFTFVPRSEPGEHFFFIIIIFLLNRVNRCIYLFIMVVIK